MKWVRKLLLGAAILTAGLLISGCHLEQLPPPAPGLPAPPPIPVPGP